MVVSHSLKFHLDKDLPKPSNDDLIILQKRVKELSQIYQPPQRSEEWYKARYNKLTASDWASALQKGKYAARKALIRSKCGEYKIFNNEFMKHGVKYEPVANMIYESRNKIKIIDFGLIPHPTIDFLGASPDGITEDGVMIEIKCPPRREITGEVPLNYWIQVQGQLEICNLERCDFLECKIEEYETDDDYFNDHYQGNTLLNSLGKEKGIILVFMQRKTKDLKFIYSPLGMQLNDYSLWCENQRQIVLNDRNYVFFTTSFWKLIDVSCVPIYRDKIWFQNILPDLQKFWNEVLHFRKIGCDSIKPIPRKKKSDKRQNHYENEDKDKDKDEFIQQEIDINSRCHFSSHNFEFNDEHLQENNTHDDDDSQHQLLNENFTNISYSFSTISENISEFNTYHNYKTLKNTIALQYSFSHHYQE